MPGDPAHQLPLTLRQLEIVDLIADGLSNEKIARRLYLSDDTVKAHVRRIFQRLGVNSRAQVVSMALKHRITEVTRGDDLVLRDIVKDAARIDSVGVMMQRRLRAAVGTGLQQSDYDWILAAAALLDRVRELSMTGTTADSVREYIYHLRTGEPAALQRDETTT